MSSCVNVRSASNVPGTGHTSSCPLTAENGFAVVTLCAPLGIGAPSMGVIAKLNSCAFIARPVSVLPMRIAPSAP